MNNLSVMAAQHEVASIKNEIFSIIEKGTIGSFGKIKQILKAKKDRLFEILSQTQCSDTDDILSMPISEIVCEINNYLPKNEKVGRKSDS